MSEYVCACKCCGEVRFTGRSKVFDRPVLFGVEECVECNVTAHLKDIVIQRQAVSYSVAKGRISRF